MEAYRLLRMILDVSQRDLARRAGISVRELSRIEKAEVMPRSFLANCARSDLSTSGGGASSRWMDV